MIETKQIKGFAHLSGKSAHVVLDGMLYAGECMQDNDVEYKKTNVQIVGEYGTVEVPALFYGDVTVGLAYETKIKTLPLSYEVAAAGRGTHKNINKVFARVAGANYATVEPNDNPKPVLMQLTTKAQNDIFDLVEVPLMGDWVDDAGITFKHNTPDPFVLQSIVFEVAQGG